MSQESFDFTFSLLDLKNTDKRLLYVGIGRYGVTKDTQLLSGSRLSITILEPWAPYIKAVRERYGNRFKYVIGDIRDFNFIFDDTRCFNYLLWKHGPEHVKRDEMWGVIELLKKHIKTRFVFSCPWGKYPQDSIEGNEYEKHLSSLYLEDFTKVGMKVKAFGKPDDCHGEIVAWWEI